MKFILTESREIEDLPTDEINLLFNVLLPTVVDSGGSPIAGGVSFLRFNLIATDGNSIKTTTMTVNGRAVPDSEVPVLLQKAGWITPADKVES